MKLHTIDKDSQLAAGMKKNNISYILLNMTFPENFPFSPPFVRLGLAMLVLGLGMLVSGLAMLVLGLAMLVLELIMLG